MRASASEDSQPLVRVDLKGEFPVSAPIAKS